MFKILRLLIGVFVIAILLSIILINVEKYCNNFISAFGAIGTIIVSIVALFYETIKFNLLYPKLVFEQYDKTDERVVAVPDNNGNLYIHFYLKVVNKSKGLVGKDIKVVLKKIYYNESIEKDVKEWKTLYSFTPLPFCWTPRETTNVTINIKDEARFDFLSITRWKDGNISYFNPSLRFQLNSISEDIAKGKYSKGSYIFETSIESESFLKSETYLIKFVWGGCWEYDPTYMDAMCSIELLDKNDISELGM